MCVTFLSFEISNVNLMIVRARVNAFPPISEGGHLLFLLPSEGQISIFYDGL
jgi:hypothetical protein